MRRLWAATKAASIGWGGTTLVADATGLSRTTITKSQEELKSLRRQKKPIAYRIRSEGSGRKSITDNYPDIMEKLEQLVDRSSRGDPENPLRWTCKSTKKLAGELSKQGYKVSDRKVANLLYQLDYSLQANRKVNEGKSHPDRNSQSEYIQEKVKLYQRQSQPVISVDAKKKELIGKYRNGGTEWTPKGNPEEVKVVDFVDKQLGKGTPYGVYDITENNGWVSVGIDGDTSEFAASTIKRWWQNMGKRTYANATDLLITADGGGSNSSRSRLWKKVLQELADYTQLKIRVCHFPPGTSKWNKIEHKMFSFITHNWRGRPLVSHEVMVNLIGNTTTKKGLKIKAELDKGRYKTGIKVSDEETSQVNIIKDKFHGQSNYEIHPCL